MDLMLGAVHRGVMFFSGLCEDTGGQVLLGPANFVDLSDGPLGLELHYSCYCGRMGVFYPKAEQVGHCRTTVNH